MREFGNRVVVLISKVTKSKKRKEKKKGPVKVDIQGN